MTDVAGPYWINYAGSEIRVCGRYGKIITRYTDEGVARAHVERLQASLPEPVVRAVSPTQDVMRLLRRCKDGIAFRAPALTGGFIALFEAGWITVAPADYGLHVTLTAAGMEVAGE
jgi:hypothetical protein